MEKRPLSLTIIGWLLIALSLLNLVVLVLTRLNPTFMKAAQQMHTSLAVQLWGVLAALVFLLCAYGILKGLPWSRVLYVVIGVINLVIGFYTLPSKIGSVVGLIILVVICAFLWTNDANDWFQARGLMLKRERSR